MISVLNKTILDLALEYHRLGWSIIPIKAGTKKPAVNWKKYQSERPDEKQLRKWFSNGKYTSLAVICGAVSGGLTVLDLDSQQRCHWWRREHSELAETLPTDKTKKGEHIFFRAEPFRKRKGDEVDLLCEGAYALLPPSPDKEWIIPLNGELPLLNPFEFGLEQFGINQPEKQAKFPEDTEEPEDLEDTDDIERHRSHKVSSVFVLDKLDDELKKEVENAIEQTLPKKQGQRNDAVLPICQWLKAIPELRDSQAKELKAIVREWHKRAYDVIGTKPFTDTWRDFVHTWKRVKWPKGEVMLKYAVKQARETVDIPPEANEYDSPEVSFLLRICYQLQLAVGDNPFFLASRTAGGIVGVCHRTAYKLLEMFVEDGKLQLVEKHTTKKAPRYRYITT